ncbi:unnamed protein product [Mucor fragilis]
MVLLASNGWKPKQDSILNIETLFTNESKFYSERYEKCPDEIVSDEAIKTDINKAVNQAGEHFLGCVVNFEFFKLITTKDSYVFSKIREKLNYKSSSYEIEVYMSSFELLAIGGVVLNTNKTASSSLGSSVKPLIAIMSHGKETVSRDIYVKKAPAEVATSERLLHQYYKAHANKKWPFHMKKLANLGFYSLSPLRVDEHS